MGVVSRQVCKQSCEAATPQSGAIVAMELRANIYIELRCINKYWIKKVITLEWLLWHYRI